MVKKTIIVLFITIFCASLVSANLMSLQGTVVDDAGDPLASADLRVRIFDNLTAGTLIFDSVSDFDDRIVNGRYDVLLGSATPLSLVYGQTYYLELRVNGETLLFGADTRQPFQSTVGRLANINITSAVDGDIFAGRQVFIGRDAGFNVEGGRVTAVGHQAGFNSTTASSSTFVGHNAGWNNQGHSTTAVGVGSAESNTGEISSGLGYWAIQHNQGNYSIGVGYRAAMFNEGDWFLGLGADTGWYNKGEQVIAIGQEGGYNNTGNNSVFLGYRAGKHNLLNNQFILRQENVNAVPLIRGNFDSGNVGIGVINEPTSKLYVNGTATVDNVLRLVPTDSPGVCDGDNKGAFYMDDSLSLPCFCNSTNWVEFQNASAVC